ncbi:ABC transporter permease [Burkholderia stabilis]|uniref:ABC transporter permease n=1 Tax=Burkholderia stabilis TaxID=95485 RepID=A0A4Q2AGX7_9BURK|nr:ABC transporter permease [Burkholderia stabilis]RXV68685.1 ABC transporter permease [Burkholderia stabilis]
MIAGAHAAAPGRAQAGSTADAARVRTARVDRVGVLIAGTIATALAFAPFVTFRANRIVAGHDLALAEIFPHWQAVTLYAAGAASALFALLRSRPVPRFAAGAVLLLGLGALVGHVPAHLVTDDNPLARVSPATGAWLLFFAYAALVVDASARLALGPVRRLAALAAACAVLAALLHAGWWDGLSVMQEYAARADTFWQEASRHTALVSGSVAAAITAGVPLGVACARSAKLRGVLLPALNIVQTIPSIAMYGLLMVPLGLLAAHVPLAAALGIRGIGAAPAALALFLYSLLPIASSVVVGLRQIPPHAVEAAAAMGMTHAQRLLQIELPLALPVILSGVRIVLVQNIGLAAVAALIGGGGFGTFIFQGIGQSATDLVLLGAIPTIALALAAAVVFDAATALAKGRRA